MVLRGCSADPGMVRPGREQLPAGARVLRPPARVRPMSGGARAARGQVHAVWRGQRGAIPCNVAVHSMFRRLRGGGGPEPLHSVSAQLAAQAEHARRERAGVRVQRRVLRQGGAGSGLRGVHHGRDLRGREHATVPDGGLLGRPRVQKLRQRHQGVARALFSLCFTLSPCVSVCVCVCFLSPWLGVPPSHNPPTFTLAALLALPPHLGSWREN
eukprot:3556557-Rhodomonas_salina.2